MFMLHFFSFVGILPFLDDIQIISSKARLPRETYMSLECSLSLCCPFPSLSVKFPNTQTLSNCKERSSGIEEQQSEGIEEPHPASWTAARILMSARSKSKAFLFSFLKSEIETGLKLMVYKCLEKNL